MHSYLAQAADYDLIFLVVVQVLANIACDLVLIAILLYPYILEHALRDL